MSGALPARPVPGGHDRRLWHRLGVVAGGPLTDWISLGVLASAVPVMRLMRRSRRRARRLGLLG